MVMRTPKKLLAYLILLAMAMGTALAQKASLSFPGSVAMQKISLQSAANGKGFWQAEFRNGIVMVFIPPGPFWMGSDAKGASEGPRHRVELPGYWLGLTEVTFDQFDEFCRKTGRPLPSDQGWGRGKRPVINVSWRDAVEYCTWLARETGLPFRLPSEAEWEKGARGTTEWKFPWGNDPVTPERANYWEAGIKRTVAVGTLPGGASSYGLQDLLGNVWEWCRDKYGNFYYRESPTIDPPGPAAGSRGVLRGGCCYTLKANLRSTNRRDYPLVLSHHTIGFRLCLRE